MKPNLKICIILTTRGNYAKMKSTMKNILYNNDLTLQIVLGDSIQDQRFGEYRPIIENDGFKIDEQINFLPKGDKLENIAFSAGQLTSRLSKTFSKLNPDIVLIIADRFEALSVAHAAVCMNKLIVHLEGGEVSGSVDERIRHAISKLAHIHLPSNKNAEERLIKMGEIRENIYVVGTPSLDLLNDINLNDKTSLQKILNQKLKNSLINLDNKYLVVSQHSVVTEYESSLFQINETMQALKSFEIPVIWILPNMDSGQKEIVSFVKQHKTKLNIKVIPSLEMELYAVLLKNCLCLIGNSSSGIRECEFLGTPVVNIGTRQNGRLRGKNVIDTNHSSKEIKKAIEYQINHGRYESDFIYGDGKSGKKIVKVLSNVKINLDKTISY